MTQAIGRMSRVLVAPWFGVAVITLLLNDCLFKYIYPGFITGKLSDLAGLLIVGALVGTLLRPVVIVPLVVGLGGFFVWWKSDLSASFVATVGQWGFPLGRIVDPTDLIALVALPAGVLLARAAIRPKKPMPRISRGTAIVFGALTLLGVSGTSQLPVRDEYQIRGRDPSLNLDTTTIEARIAEILLRSGMTRAEESDTEGAVSYRKGAILVRYWALP
jgi:hypothetical protein